MKIKNKKKFKINKDRKDVRKGRCSWYFFDKCLDLQKFWFHNKIVLVILKYYIFTKYLCRWEKEGILLSKQFQNIVKVYKAIQMKCLIALYIRHSDWTYANKTRKKLKKNNIFTNYILFPCIFDSIVYMPYFLGIQLDM